MELWYSEFHTGNVKLSVRINRQLFSGESEFQRIDVFESEEFGRFVALDGEIVFSDKDEFIYDEMVTHVPMTVHPNVKNVLIIGGGDGGGAGFHTSDFPAAVHRGHRTVGHRPGDRCGDALHLQRIIFTHF